MVSVQCVCGRNLRKPSESAVEFEAERTRDAER